MNDSWFFVIKRFKETRNWEIITEFMKRKAEKIFEEAGRSPNEEPRRLLDYDQDVHATRMKIYHKRPKY